MSWKTAVATLAFGGLAAYGQPAVERIEIHADPAPLVRPFETITLQVRVYGTLDGQEGRLRRDGAELEIVEPDGGWLTKPFRYQGKDDEEFLDEFQSTAGRIFGQLAGEFVLQDAVLYIAPEKPGRYTVRAELEGRRAEITIEVSRSAPSYKKPEKYSFGTERRPADPYRRLAEHWAPVIAQETWWQPKSDYIARFDYDGDWHGDNNWKHLEEGASQAYVYYAAMETRTHWFLVYNVFHPRDYSDKCVAGTCHENDNEGLILAILKDGSEFGRLQAMETLAHNNIYSFRADRDIRKGVHNIDGRIEFRGHRPVVFIESGGHGIYGTRSSHARYDVANDRFTAGTGVTYVYKGKAERPRHPNDRDVGYELLSIYHEWWLKTGKETGWRQRTFDGYFTYEPFGGRPRAAFASIGGAFYGRRFGRNKAKPFWGWHDNRTRKRKVLAVGQWGLDPAYAMSRNLKFPEPYSVDYVFNPYLGIGKPSYRMTGPAPVAPPAPPAAPAAGTSGGPMSGTYEFTAVVDGSVEALIRRDYLSFYVLSGAPDVEAEFDPAQAIPAAELAEVRVKKLRGRGEVRLMEKPSPENGYSLRIRIDDPKGGRARYRIRVEWRR